MDETPRIRRLRKDEEDLKRDIHARSELITYTVQGQTPGIPPEMYEVTYHVKGIVGVDASDNPVYGHEHRVRILLHDKYPRLPPGLKWVTPIWHPNIHHVTKDVCIDQVLWAPTRTLESLVTMMGEMIQGKNVLYKNRVPYPLDREAAAWYERYVERMGWDELHPTDDRQLLLPEGTKPKHLQTNQPSSGGGRIKLGGSGSKQPTESIQTPPETTPPQTTGRIKLRGSSNTQSDQPTEPQSLQQSPPSRIKIRGNNG